MAFETEIERVSKIIAEDHLLKVRLRGTMAYSVPGMINLPTPDVYQYLGRDAKRMIRGIGDHEVAHQLFTDHKCSAAASGSKEDQRYVVATYPQVDAKHLAALAGPVLQLTWNAIEDAWIETKMGQRYPGAAQNLYQKDRWFLERRDPRVPKPTDLWMRYILALSVVARPSAEIDEWAPGGPQEDEDVWKMLRASRRLMLRVEEAHDSGDCLAIAIDVMRLFDKESREEEEEKPKSKPEACDDEDGEADESDEGEDEDEEGEDEDEEGESEEGEDGESEEDEALGAAGEDDESESAASDDEDDEESLADEYKMDLRNHEIGDEPVTPEAAINKVLTSVMEESRDRPYIVFSHDFDLERDFSEDDLSEHSALWEKIQAEARSASDALTETFEVALRAQRDKHLVAGYDEGIVDVDLLGEFSCGAIPADEIFQKESAIDDREVAVAVLIDCSGSMGGSANPRNPSALARLSAVAMHEALARCQIAHEITGFTTVTNAGVGGRISSPWLVGKKESEAYVNFRELRKALEEERKRGRDISKYARSVRGGYYQVPIHAIFKSFASPDARALVRVTGLMENLDGEAVMWQARRLTTRPEPRRIMFVLSDGEPLGANNGRSQQTFLKESIERVIEAGIEVYGIGIQTDHVKRYYPRWWVAHTLNQLCDVAMGGMIEVLTEARQEHKWVQLTA